MGNETEEDEVNESDEETCRKRRKRKGKAPAAEVGPFNANEMVSNSSSSEDEDYDSDNPGQLRNPPNEEDEMVEDDFVPLNEKWYVLNSEFPHFCPGMRFEDRHQFKEAMAKYAILKSCAIWAKKNDKVRVRYKCRETCDSCIWGF